MFCIFQKKIALANPRNGKGTDGSFRTAHPKSSSRQALQNTQRRALSEFVRMPRHPVCLPRSGIKPLVVIRTMSRQDASRVSQSPF